MTNNPPETSTGSPRHYASIDYRVLTTVDSYAEAQHRVDTLSDSGFPVENLRIVGVGLQSVEQITGRRTVVSAAWQSGLAGAWMALFVGLMFSLFAPVTIWQVFLAAIVFGFAFGAVFGAVGHAMLGGQRDFSSITATQAQFYEIHVVAGLVEDAKRILRI